MLLSLDEIKNIIKDAADIKNAAFFQKISPAAVNVTGVRIPVIRNLAKKIARSRQDCLYFLKEYEIENHEEFILKGVVIASAKIDIDEKLALFKPYMEEIYDWSACDIAISSFKFKEAELKHAYDFILPYRHSRREYELQCLLVMLLEYFVTDDYFNNITDILDNIYLEDYYVKMAAAWLISVIFIKNRDGALKYLKNNGLDDWTYSKALQKITESSRVSAYDKDIIRAMKRR